MLHLHFLQDCIHQDDEHSSAQTEYAQAREEVQWFRTKGYTGEMLSHSKCFRKKIKCLQLPWLRSIYYLYDFGTKLSNLEMSQCFHGHIYLIDYTGKGR